MESNVTHYIASAGSAVPVFGSPENSKSSGNGAQLTEISGESQGELWKSCVYDERLSISSLGRVARLLWDGQVEIVTPKLLCGRPTLRSKSKMYTIHHLVARAFCPGFGHKKSVCHRDDDPLNNRAENLYWGTQRQNSIDASVNGRLKRKLTPDDVRQIRTLRDQLKPSEIAVKFGVTGSAITKIFKGWTWVHVQ